MVRCGRRTSRIVEGDWVVRLAPKLMRDPLREPLPRIAVRDHEFRFQGDDAMQKRRAVRNALFLLAACATAQAAGLTESIARTSPRTPHDVSTRSLKGRHAGERMNPGALTAAHPSLPFGTKVRVTNKHTGRSVVVRINDRGPFVKGRVIDLSPAAAKAIGVGGIAQVSLSTN
jgi:hypothetical protein